jgi:hypothetical protein
VLAGLPPSTLGHTLTLTGSTTTAVSVRAYGGMVNGQN